MFLRPYLLRAARVSSRAAPVYSSLATLRPRFRAISCTNHYKQPSEQSTNSTSSEKHKANSGAHQAAIDLGEATIEDKARVQSVSWHRTASGHKPTYQFRCAQQDEDNPEQGKEGIVTDGARVVELHSHLADPSSPKGKLLSTPSRLLKLLLPLQPIDPSGPHGSEPLALLAHPHQPLSYLERLLQSELPPIENGSSPPRPPDIKFLARAPADPSSPDSPTTSPSSSHPDLVRFSPATETGDFLRDASKTKFFLLQIEGFKAPIRVVVPSFQDRTYFLRQRLHATSAEIAAESKIKDECDKLAQRGAQRVAITGFIGLISWWGAVTWATFWTPLGWDVMEPVTYLVGLSGVISGYLWFLYHNREVSYRSVLHLTVSRRQVRLYEERGFDLERWHELLEEGKAIRREIRAVAAEYDEEWDERKDEVMSGTVKKALDDHEKKGEQREAEKEAKVEMEDEEEMERNEKK